MTRLLAIAIALCVLALSARAGAHGSRTAYLDVIEISATEAMASLRDGSDARLTVTSPDCTVEAVTRGAASQSVAVSRLRCPGGLAGATLELRGLSRTDDVVVARVMLDRGATHSAVLTLRAPRLVIPIDEKSTPVFSRYLRLGIDHVLSGLDHLLFLLALVWQTHAASRGRLRGWAVELARHATGFTLAHTVTLTATALGWLRVPSDVAEIMIAVSLVMVALDIGKKPLGLVMAFGLVHGLGFASALAEARLPEHAVALGLVAFNVGVELGQLIAIASAIALFTIIGRLVSGETASAPRFVRRHAGTACAYAVGVTGAYLVIARAMLLLR